MIMLPLFIVNSYESNAISPPQEREENKLNAISEGTLAPDFNITDVDSGITYNLSDFLGKIVMLDLFATWCGPCIAALPIIHELYLLYPEDMFQIISIDVDTTETVSQVKGFRRSYDMDWIVGLDQLINDERYIADSLRYGTGFIPTMYLLNETGHVIYAEVGFDEPTVRGILSSLLPDDTQTPAYEEILFYNNTELSIFNPTFWVYANITEDRNLKIAEVRILTLDGKQVSAAITKYDGYYIMNDSITIDPTQLYPHSSLQLRLYTKDYFDNSNASAVIDLPITKYYDSAAPTISSVGVEWANISETRYNVTVYANLEEDLVYMKKDVWFMVGESVKKAATFFSYNATHMMATAELLYSQAMPWELTAHIVVIDVVGNEVTADFIVADPPSTDPNDETSLAIFASLLGLFGVAIAVQLKKRK